MEPLLDVKNLSVKFGDVMVLESVNFSLGKGDILTIIGPNGAGKTVLVKSILGLIPHEGEVAFNGRQISTQLTQIGYVPQGLDFDRTFPITAKELLDLVSKKATPEEIKTVCQHLEIEKILSKKIGTLSGGQMQRILIARAVSGNPKLLIMDEPTAGVDIGGVKSFYDIVEHLNKEHGITIILISHEIDMVYSLASKVLCLNKKMLCVGTPKEAITKNILEKLYGGNFGPKEHIHLQ
jgi:zinc transport system ATP-binding protein